MARMIPAFIDEDSPPGERDVWHMLAGGPADWTVLHALDLAPWRRNSRTEVDFVVIVPDVGLLCIEVKATARASGSVGQVFKEGILYAWQTWTVRMLIITLIGLNLTASAYAGWPIR